MESSKLRSYRVLGADVSDVDLKGLNSLVSRSIRHDEKNVIAHHNLHSLYTLRENDKMKKFYNMADVCHADGMGVVLFARIAGVPLQRTNRVTYLDWVPSIMEMAQDNDWKIFYLGAKPEILEKGIRKIRQKYPCVRIEGHHGYFSWESYENGIVLSQIRDYSPHILFVGMGMPLQELWIYENIEQITANVVLPSGGYIDYIAGRTDIPPRWMGAVGLEWLYRVLKEPRRLWFRGLVEPVSLVPSLLIESVRNRLNLE